MGIGAGDASARRRISFFLYLKTATRPFLACPDFPGVKSSMKCRLHECDKRPSAALRSPRLAMASLLSRALQFTTSHRPETASSHLT